MNRIIPIVFAMVFISQTTTFSADYYPISVGQFSVWAHLDSAGNVTSTDSLLFDSTMSISVGMLVYWRSTASKPIGSRERIPFLDSGNTVSIPLVNTPIVMGRHRFVEGEKFVGIGGDTLRSHYVGTRTATIGVFDSCWFAQYIGAPQAGFVYAPNVGVIEQLGLNGEVAGELRNYGSVTSTQTTVGRIRNSNPTANVQKGNTDLLGRLQGRVKTGKSGIVIQNGRKLSICR